MSVNYHKKALEILVNVHVDHEPMLRWIAVHNPAAFVAAFEATRANVDPHEDHEFRRYIAEGRKLHAIKRWRQMTGDGLVESKDAVESFVQAASRTA